MPLRRGLLALAIVWLATSSLACRSSSHLERRATPRGWVAPPWGPDAEAARRSGALPPAPTCARASAWEGWAAAHLQTGDILFRRGRDATGPPWIAKVAAHMSGSPYAHVAVFAWEGGRPVVYDAKTGGLRRQPFGVWMHDVLGPFGVRRVRPEHRHRIPGAVAFCRDAYARRVPFDPEMTPDDEKLYCTEFVEKAYRSAGLALSDPVRLADLPNYDAHPCVALVLRLFSPVDARNAIFSPGNARYGQWASPSTVAVFATPDGRMPPR